MARSSIPVPPSPGYMAMSSNSNAGQGGLCLLGNLLDHPPEEVGDLLFDPEPFQLGGDLAAVVGGVNDNVAQDRPPRQSESAADRAQRQHGVEPIRRERGTQILEAAVGTLQQPPHRPPWP